MPVPLHSLADLQAFFHRQHANPVHLHRFLRSWLQARTQNFTGRGEARIPPASLHATLAELGQALDGLVRLHDQQQGPDALRLLLALRSGQSVETILLPRNGVCVSTQVGCAVGCRFCMTGRDGLLQQLGSLEILAQVVMARKIRPVKKVVFMGMGEPSHNMDAVLEAINALGLYGDIAYPQLVFSTVGDRRVFARLPQNPVRPALALSLHTTRRQLRRQLLPQAADIEVAELVEEAECYARQIRYPVQYQWTLLAGINDSLEEMDAVVRLLKGKRAIMNLIAYNENEGMGYQRPAAEQTRLLLDHLLRNGIFAKLRQSAGQEIDGGCGQLRVRSLTAIHGSRHRPATGPSADSR